MKKLVIPIIVIVALIIFGISQLNFSDVNTYNNKKSNIVVGKKDKSNTDKSNKVKITMDSRVLLEKSISDKLKPELKKYVSKNGYIVKNLEVEVIGDNHTVAQVVDAIAKSKDIKIDYAKMGTMKYINAINHIGGKATGDMSGWLYQINGKMPLDGIEQAKVKDGDAITFMYSSDGGKDFEKLK